MRHPAIRTCTLASALLLVLAAPAAAERAIDQTLVLPADGELSVEIVSGSLVVRGWERGEVRVTGSVGDDVDDLDIGSEGDRAWIELDTDRSRRHADLDAHLEIRLPATARLEIDTVSAGIEASELAGVLELGTVSGEISVSGSPSSLDVETVSGSVRLDGSGSRTGPPVSVETVSGSVVLHGVGASVEVSTVSGRIRIEAVGQVTDVDLEAVSGAIDLEAALAPDARVDINSHSSSVTLRLPADTSAFFDISTFSGSIENDFGPAARRSDRFGPGRSLEFSSGDGDARVSVETFSGSVSLERR